MEGVRIRSYSREIEGIHVPLHPLKYIDLLDENHLE